jgi:N-acetylglucosamine kinase-like BadF-type ATPase
VARSLPIEICALEGKKQVPRKSKDWLTILSEVLEICAIRSGIEEEEVIQAMIASKTKRLEDVIAYSQKKECKVTVAYLQNARGDLFTALSNRLQGKTTSRVERLFRSVNMRINVGKWSTTGGLNVTKVRLAYYYNWFDA